MSKITLVEQASDPPTPDSGKAITYVKTDKNLYLKDDAGTVTDLTVGGGSSLPVTDTTSIVEDGADPTKEMRIDVGAVATGTVRVLTMPNADVTLPDVPVGTTDAQTLTNKTIDADNSTITNIGAAEVKANLVNGQTADASPDGAVDYVMTHDGSASALKKVLLDNLPGAGGTAISFAILRDEKTTGTQGGGASAATWNARDLNTETYDPDAIVSISSNQFTPISGDYILSAYAAGFQIDKDRIRLYNVTGTASVEEGISGKSAATDTTTRLAFLTCKFTANGTDAYRIDHYSASAKATSGLGVSVGDGSAEVFLTIRLEKVA